MPLCSIRRPVRGRGCRAGRWHRPLCRCGGRQSAEGSHPHPRAAAQRAQVYHDRAGAAPRHPSSSLPLSLCLPLPPSASACSHLPPSSSLCLHPPPPASTRLHPLPSASARLYVPLSPCRAWTSISSSTLSLTLIFHSNLTLPLTLTPTRASTSSSTSRRSSRRSRRRTAATAPWSRTRRWAR